jgi:acetoacetyl-CoA synthetase
MMTSGGFAELGGGVLAERMPQDAGLMFQPSHTSIAGSQLTSFIQYSASRRDESFTDYESFEAFAKEDFRAFWRLFFEWSKLAYDGDTEPVCAGDTCERATFFPNVRLNYAEVLLSTTGSDRTTITACHGDGRRDQITRRELSERVVQLAGVLRDAGVRRGDHVAAIARNNLEAVVAACATAAIGAVFSSCSPDMGAFAILSRFAPLKPAVLCGNLQEELWDTGAPIGARFAEVAAGLPSLMLIIALDQGAIPSDIKTPVRRLLDVTCTNSSVAFEWKRFPFNHPLFVMFSS